MNLRKLPALPHWLLPIPEARIAITYLWRHGRLPDLADPRRFTELVQKRKLEDRDPRLPPLVDKVTAKGHAARLLGEEWTIPTLWSGPALPALPPWRFPFIVKASHGCNQSVICHNADDWDNAVKQSRKWVRAPYGLWLDEWAYRDLERGLIVEPYLGDGQSLPIDYKFYVFGGRESLVQVHRDRAGDHRWTLYDRLWTQVSNLHDQPSLPPQSLDRMLHSAERLAQGFDFARVDFYEIGGAPKFGEMTFYPGSGLDPFDPPELDEVLGALWREAIDEPSVQGGDIGWQPVNGLAT